MKRPLPLVAAARLGGTLSLALLLLLAAVPRARAQAPAPTPAAASALDPTTDPELVEIEAIDARRARKMDALRELIQQQEQAKSLSPDLAGDLRFGLRALALASDLEVDKALPAARLPADNPRLTEAVQALGTEWTASRAARLALLKKATGDMRGRVEQVARSARTPGEVISLLTALDRLQQLSPVRNNEIASALGSLNLNAYREYLKAIRRYLELQAATPAPDLLTFADAIDQLQEMSSSISPRLDSAAVDQRVKEALAPFVAAQAAAEEKFQRLLTAVAPLAELQAARTELDEASSRLRTVRARTRRIEFGNTGDLSSYYGMLLQAAEHLEARRFAQAQASLAGLRRTNYRNTAPGKATWLDNVCTQFEKAIATGMGGGPSQLVGRLTSAAAPAQLAALGRELLLAEAATASDRDLPFPRGLGGQVNALAAAWAGADLNLQAQLPPLPPGDPQLDAALAALRGRVQRTVLTAQLQAPELTQPPLAELPLPEALAKYIAQLAAQGDWRRLLECLQASPAGTLPKRDAGLVEPVRAYLAGQNLEQAELWPDALRSYRAVLQSVDDRAPIKAAADRIKAITKDHPTP